jgi:hypothetical protein
VAVIWLQPPASAGTATAGKPAPVVSPPAASNGLPLKAASKPASPVPPPPRKPSTTPAVTPQAPVATMVASFSNLKLLVTLGPIVEERDVTIGLWNQRLAIVPPNGHAPIVTLPYGVIEKSTYVRARNPQWDPALAGPAGALDLPGPQRHWLAIQSKDAFAILRLDGGGWQRVIEAYESISGRRIDRPAVEK